MNRAETTDKNTDIDREAHALRLPPSAGSLPHALVFFLTSDQRRAVIRTLRAIDPSRESALPQALKVDAQ